MPRNILKNQLKSSTRLVSATSTKSVAPNSVVHSVPIISQAQNKKLTNISLPVGIKNIQTDIQNLQSSTVLNLQTQQNSSQSSQTLSNPNSDYTFVTGLKDGEPTIVLTSEFFPLYDYKIGELNPYIETLQGDALNLKEQSKILTAVTAINVIQQSNSLKNLIKNNKKELSDFISLIDGGQEISVFNSLYLFTPSAFNNLELGTFLMFLESRGYKKEDIQKFKETKIWLQSLYELKRDLFSTTQVVGKFKRGTYSNYSLDLDEKSINRSGEPRVVINPVVPFELPDIDPINPFQGSETYYDYNSKMYSVIHNYENVVESDFQRFMDVVDEDDGDVNIAKISLSNLFKEIRYSSYLSDVSKRIILEGEYSFPVIENRGYKVWDALIGKIPGICFNKLDPYSPSDRFDSKSISSICQDYSKTQGSKIVTFEDPDFSNTEYVSGYSYYVENSLIDFLSTNSTVKIDEFIEKIRKAKDSTEILLNLIGSNEEYTQYNPFQEKITEGIFDTFSSEDMPGAGHLKKIFDSRTENSRFISSIFDLSLKRNRIVFSRDSNFLKYLLFCFIVISIKSNESSREQSAIFSFSLDKIVNKISDVLIDSFTVFLSRDEIPYRASDRFILGSRTAQNVELTDAKKFLKDVVKRELIKSLNGPILKSISNVLKSIKDLNKIYDSNGKTSYSGLSKNQLMFLYFDAMIRLISSQSNDSIENFYIASDGSVFLCGIKLKEASSDAYYKQGYSGSGPTIDFLPKLKLIKQDVLEDMDEKFKYLSFFRWSLVKILDGATNLKSSMNKAKAQVQQFNTLFDSELDSNLIKEKSELKNRLLKMSLSSEQIRMLKYSCSELKDRLELNPTSAQSLSVIPNISNLLSDDFLDFSPVDVLKLFSHQSFSKYYKNNDFFPLKGVNKRILSVGIPNGLSKKINTNNITNPVLHNLVKIKVWKIDRVFPDILFKPKEYVFDMNRFSTRSIMHWDLNLLDPSSEDFDLLSVPTKYYSPSDKKFFVHKKPDDIQQQIQDALYLLSIGGLSEAEKILNESYKNQVLSFIAEEYLYWYTDTDFNESQYFNYSKISNNDVNLNSYLSVVRQIKKENIITRGNSNSVQFFDQMTGDIVTLPVNRPPQGLTNLPTVNTSVVLDMSDTLFSYLKTPTLFNDVDSLKKKLLYPKKFDRVFNLIIDPDDFIVERSAIGNSRIVDLLSKGIFIKNDQTGLISMKDTKQDDASFYELFVTIEPYSV